MTAQPPDPRDRPTTDETRPSPDHPPDRRAIGPYRLLEPLGEGGMGIVWLAERVHPVHRRVALKVIKAGMDTRQVVSRFEAERQALALMDHPAIATVFDGGATDDGRPYFVMEYVKGEAITTYCDRQRLTIQERLELFIEVCEGVQHAHQKGIIHRDLKPSNVLVTIQGDRATPKIIDFGVAKATAQPLTDRSLFTEIGVLIGTPEYMSPEQAEMSGLDVDTRSDVYALGVVLYELLTGALPFDRKKLHAASLDEVRRTIRDTDPPRPSTRVTALGVDTPVVARQRRADPTQIARQLRGDLDWIVMKALEKDRTRRYQTANAFAMDVRRHLRCEPVYARPASALYRAQRFARRNRTAVTAAAFLLIALVLGVVGTSVGLVRARRAEVQAREEAATASRVSDFLVRLFEVSDPDEARGNTVTAREILDRGAERIRRELQDEPRVQTRLMHTIGKVYDNLGLFDRSRSLLEETLATREAALGPEHPDVAETCVRLADVYRQQGRFDAAETLFKRALAIREKHFGADDPIVADSLSSLAVNYENAERLDEAEPLYQRALAIRDRPGRDERALTRPLLNLGVVAAKKGDKAKAEALFRRTLEIQERILGPTHPDVGVTCNNLGIIYKMQKRYAEAESQYGRALEIRKKTLGPRHPAVADTLHNIANVRGEQGHYDAAEPLLRDAIAIYEEAFGPVHPVLAGTIDDLAGLLFLRHEYEPSEALYLRALAIREKTFRSDHPHIANNLFDLAKLYRELKRYAEAERLLRRSLDLRERADPSAAATGDSAFALGEVLRELRRVPEAAGFLARAFEIRMKALPIDHADRALTTRTYVEVLRTLGRQGDADAILRRAGAEAVSAAGR